MTTSHERQVPRIGVLWRGDRRAPAPVPAADRGMGRLFDAFASLPVTVEMVPYSDDAVDEVRGQLSDLDGVLVWVNPIQDGASRALLDPLLREASEAGVWVSAHPDVILQMGTKEILHRTRHLGWGTDTSLYQTPAEFTGRFPGRLARLGRLVLKQARGNGGNGVWKAELPGGEPGPAAPDTIVRVRDARSRDGSSEQIPLSSFMRRCEEYFAWSGCLIDQPFQDRLADGMIRCYLTHDKVVGFCRQWPAGLLDNPQPRPASVMHGPGASGYQALREQAETQWVPQMLTTLGITADDLPVIWDADFLFGPETAGGDDSYVLCETNASAVWPFPPQAAPIVVAAALNRTLAARALRPAATAAADTRRRRGAMMHLDTVMTMVDRGLARLRNITVPADQQGHRR